MNFRRIIKLSLTFLVPLIALFVLIPMYFDLELTDNSIKLLLLSSLFITGIINLYRRFGHFGHVPILAGLSLLGLSGLAFYASVGINGSEKLIELSARSQGYVLIGIVIGIVLLAFGVKSALGFSYGWGNIKGRR